MTSPLAVYGAADQSADFGSLPGAITVAIAQMSSTEGLGIAAMDTFNV